jgi:hypothetical protein
VYAQPVVAATYAVPQQVVYAQADEAGRR